MNSYEYVRYRVTWSVGNRVFLENEYKDAIELYNRMVKFEEEKSKELPKSLSDNHKAELFKETVQVKKLS
jgi:hypothetical protein